MLPVMRCVRFFSTAVTTAYLFVHLSDNSYVYILTLNSNHPNILKYVNYVCYTFLDINFYATEMKKKNYKYAFEFLNKNVGRELVSVLFFACFNDIIY